MPTTGFELQISGIRSDRSTNWATTTAPYVFLQSMLSSFSMLKLVNGCLLVKCAQLHSVWCWRKEKEIWLEGRHGRVVDLRPFSAPKCIIKSFIKVQFKGEILQNYFAATDGTVNKGKIYCHYLRWQLCFHHCQNRLLAWR